MLAVAIGGASLVNAKLVMRYGMRALSNWSLWGIFAVSVVFAAVAAPAGPSAALVADGLSDGVVLRHRPALREPQCAGHAAARRIAGTGAAVVGATSMLISLTLGTVDRPGYNGTVLPLVSGFAVLSACSILVAWWAEGPTREAARTPVAETEIG